MRYVEESCTFPNSMVDRITPQTAPTDRAWLSEAVGLDDAWLSSPSPFANGLSKTDSPPGGRSTKRSARCFTDRVHDGELYKLRMLNASIPAWPTSPRSPREVTYVDEAIAVAALRRYLERFLGEEAIPTLD